MVAFKVIFDFGGTIARDSQTYRNIAVNANNDKADFKGPDSWDGIRFVGSVNYFDIVQHKYFSMCNYYPQAVDCVLDFYGDKGDESKSFAYVVYDNRPLIKNSKIEALLSMDFYKRGGKANGFYADSDKLRLAKSLQADVVVDDDPRMAVALAYAGVKTIVPLRKWNSSFELNNLRFYIPEHKIEKVRENIFFAEDFVEVNQIVSELIKLKTDRRF